MSVHVHVHVRARARVRVRVRVVFNKNHIYIINNMHLKEVLKLL